MSDAPTLIQSYLSLSKDDVSKSKLPQELAGFVESKQITLLGVTKLLAAPLTSEDVDQRGRGIGLLAQTLSKLPLNSVNRQEVRYLCDFFSSDSTLSTETTVEAVTGLTALAKLPLFGNGDATQVIQAIFANTNMRKLHQSTRFLIFQLIDVLLTKHKSAFQKMGPDFIKAYCSLADGEKDPRNLKIAFDLDRTILLDFDVSECVEDLFDITFCYFPITFTPPPDDPYGITSEELQGLLRKTLSSSAAFGKLAMPLILDKLSTSSKSAKRQSMELIIEAAPIYGQSALLELAEALWQALSLEVFNATDNALEELAYEAMRSFLAALIPDQTEEEPSLDDKQQSMIDKTIKVCSTEMQDVSKTSAKSASKILGSVCSASHLLSSYALAQVIPLYVSMLRDKEMVAQRAHIFGLLRNFFASLCQNPAVVDISAIQSCKDELLSYLMTTIEADSSSSSAEVAIEAAVQMSKLNGLLDSTDIKLVVAALNDLLKTESNAEEASIEAAVVGLQTLTDRNQHDVQETTLPLLLSQIPHSGPAGTHYKSSLNNLVRLCMPPDFFEYFLLRLLSRLEASSQLEDMSRPDHLLAHHLLIAMRATINMKLDRSPSDVVKHAPKLITRLFQIYASPKAGRIDSAQLMLVNQAGRILQLLLQHTDTQFQSLLVRDNFGSSFTSSNQAQIILCGWSVVSVRAETISAERVPVVWRLFYVTSLSNDCEHTHAACHAALACLVNKHANELKSDIRNAMEDSNLTALYIRTLSWIARGLVPLNNSDGYAIVDKILGICGQESELAMEAAKSLRNIVVDGDELLTKKNHYIFKLLYKQKYYTSTVQKIVANLALQKINANYLTALAWLLEGMPQQLANTEVPKHVAYFTRTLDIADIPPQAKSSVIRTCTKIIADTPSILSASVSGLISSLIKIVALQDAAFTECRVDALQSLTVIAEQYDHLTLQAHRGNALKTLGRVIDDKRRVIRREAVECRSAWFQNAMG